MSRLGKCALGFGLLCLLCAPLRGQERPQRAQGAGMMSALALMDEPSVQQELKMSQDQITKATESRKKQEEASRGLRELSREEQRAKRQELDKESDKLAADILKPDQAKRLQQIRLQQRRSRAFADEAVAKELNLTDDQKKKLREIQEDGGRQLRDLFGGGGGGGQNAEMRQKMEELAKETDTKSVAVLTPEQKTKWTEMQGAPFKGEFRPRQNRRPGGDGG